MLVDHVGVFLFPEVSFLRIIGRLAFPIFIWLVICGEKRTSNFWTYLFRLIGVGILTQPIYFLTGLQGLNVLFALSLGLIGLRIQSKFSNLISTVSWVALATVAHYFNFEYGWYGIWSFCLLSKIDSSWNWWLFWAMINFVYSATVFPLQFFAFFVPVLISFWNGEYGRNFKQFYYVYPGQFICFLGLNSLLP